MSYYPVFLDIKDREVLIVGGGRVAQRKAATLLGFGARVRVVSRKLTRELEHLVDEGLVEWMGPEFSEESLGGVFLVIAATDDADLNHQVSQAAEKRGVLVNAVDQPQDCSFIVPSIVRRGDLMLAVSTSGKSPALAKKIRGELESRFCDEYGTYLELLGRIRKKLLCLDLGPDQRGEIFKALVDSDLFDLVRQNDWEGARSTLEKLLPRSVDIEDLSGLFR